MLVYLLITIDDQNDWISGVGYNYWTMTPSERFSTYIGKVFTKNDYREDEMFYLHTTIRPVINVKKSAIESSD